VRSRLRTDSCLSATRSIVPEIDRRNVDTERNDTTFRSVYFDSRRRFAFPENPLLFNRRQLIQQGAFLCPGDVSKPFAANLKAMEGFRDSNHVLKLRIELTPRLKREAVEDLLSMNVGRASLFPGLDGFASSLGLRIWLYRDMARRGIGHQQRNKGLRPTTHASRPTDPVGKTARRGPRRS